MMKWGQELSPGAGQHLEERKMNEPRVWEVAAWKVESKARGGLGVLEARWRMRKQWAALANPARRTSEVRTENWLLGLATWRSLVGLISISQWDGGVESLSVMDSRQRERRGGYDGEHALILWGILLYGEQGAELLLSWFYFWGGWHRQVVRVTRWGASHRPTRLQFAVLRYMVTPLTSLSSWRLFPWV